MQSSGECADDWVVPFVTEGGHVEDIANRFPSSLDHAAALELPAVTIEGGNTHNRCNLLAGQVSKLWQFGHEGGCRLVTYPRNTFGLLVPVPPVIVSLHALKDAFFDRFDVLIDCPNEAQDALANESGHSYSNAVFLRSAMLNELPSTSDKLTEFFDFSLFFPRNWLDFLGELSEHCSIDPIGLGQDVEGSGEVAHLSRVHDCDTMTIVHQRPHNFPLVASGRLHNNEDSPRSWQHFEQTARAVCRIFQAMVRPVWSRENIQVGF